MKLIDERRIGNILATLLPGNFVPRAWGHSLLSTAFGSDVGVCISRGDANAIGCWFGCGHRTTGGAADGGSVVGVDSDPQIVATHPAVMFEFCNFHTNGGVWRAWGLGTRYHDSRCVEQSAVDEQDETLEWLAGFRGLVGPRCGECSLPLTVEEVHICPECADLRGDCSLAVHLSIGGGWPARGEQKLRKPTNELMRAIVYIHAYIYIYIYICIHKQADI